MLVEPMMDSEQCIVAPSLARPFALEMNVATSLLFQPIPTAPSIASMPSADMRKELEIGKQFSSLNEAVAIIERFDAQQSGGQRSLQVQYIHDNEAMDSGCGGRPHIRNAPIALVACEFHPWCNFHIKLRTMEGMERIQITQNQLFHHAQCDGVLVKPAESMGLVTEFLQTPCHSQMYTEKNISPIHDSQVPTSLVTGCKRMSASLSPAAEYRYLARKKQALSLSPSSVVSISTPEFMSPINKSVESKYSLSTEARWPSAKEAAHAIHSYSYYVQRKRTKMDKRSSGGRNKKYVCAHRQCNWFVRLLKVAKMDNWKISSMSLQHSPECRADFPPTYITPRFLQNTSKLTMQSPGVSAQDNDGDMASDPVSNKLMDTLTQTLKRFPQSVISSRSDDQSGTLLSTCITLKWICPMLPCLQSVYGIDVFPCAPPKAYDDKARNEFGQRYFVAVIGKDGNLQPILVAFGFVPELDDHNIQWFVRELEGAGFLLNETAVFVPHNREGVIRGIKSVFSQARPLFCTESLLETIQNTLGAPVFGDSACPLRDLIKSAQIASNHTDFNDAMNNIAASCESASAFLRSLKPADWAMHANHGTRVYGWSTTELSEYLMTSSPPSNQQASDSLDSAQNLTYTKQDLPFLDVIELTKYFINDSFEKQCHRSNNFKELNSERKNLSGMHNSYEKNQHNNTPTDMAKYLQMLRLTPNATNHIMNELIYAGNFHTKPEDKHVAFVSLANANGSVVEHRVNLLHRTCSCSAIFQLGLPCAHFIAAAHHMNDIPSIMLSTEKAYTMLSYRVVCASPDCIKASATSPTHSSSSDWNATGQYPNSEFDLYDDEEEDEDHA